MRVRGRGRGGARASQVREYEPAALRLDTAPYIPIDYLREFRRHAGVPIYGEVTTSNYSYLTHFIDAAEPAGASAANATDTGRVLDAVTHFGLFQDMRRGFCGQGHEPAEVDAPAAKWRAVAPLSGWAALGSAPPSRSTRNTPAAPLPAASHRSERPGMDAPAKARPVASAPAAMRARAVVSLRWATAALSAVLQQHLRSRDGHSPSSAENAVAGMWTTIMPSTVAKGQKGKRPGARGRQGQ